MARAAVIGFVGLGHMGAALARRSLAAGGTVLVYDLAPQAVASLAALGAEAAPDLAAMFRRAEVVAACLPSAAACRAVAAEAVKAAGAGACAVRLWIEASTIGRRACAGIAADLAAAGIAFADAPVSGGPRGKALSTMLAVPQALRAQAEAEVGRYSDRIIAVGEEPGQAQICKLVNNAISLATLAIACEATASGVRAGLDLAVMVEAINAGSGRCAATTDKFPQAIVTRRFDYGAAARIAAKDMALFLEEAETAGGRLACLPQIAALWRTVADEGPPDMDFTSIFKYFEEYGRPLQA